MRHSARSRYTLDGRAIFYRMGRQAVVIVAAVLLIKVILADIVAVRGDQMAPSVTPGDRCLVLRLTSLPLVRDYFPLSRNSPVVFSFPRALKTDGRRGCLRIAGIAGDTVSIENGAFRNSRGPAMRPAIDSGEVAPANYSPRDFLPAVRVPGPGDILRLDSLDLYPLFCAIAVIQQENAGAAFSLTPRLTVNGSPRNDYYLSDFALYKGRLDSIPEAGRWDWFFWYRLGEYLQQVLKNRTVALSLVLTMNGVPLHTYAVKKKFVFLLADNWKQGMDSRYFGPVAASAIFGRPVAVLWSSSGKKVNFKRMGRIIK